MAQPLDYASLTEELTVQQVILDSLDGEDFPCAEESRDDARKEIARIKTLLNQLSQNGANRQEASSLPDQPQPCTDTVTEDCSLQAPSAATEDTPSIWHAPASLSTPPRRAVNVDSWDSPTMSVLSSRKRGRQLSDSDVFSPRRPTPQRGPLRSSQNIGSNDIEIIDLTGDDVGSNAVCVAEQIKQQKRSEQEVNDRKLALELSSQSPSSSAGLPLAATDSGSGHADAFSKMMATQQSNAHRAVSDWNWMSTPDAQVQPGLSLNSPSRTVPGAWVEDIDYMAPGSHAFAAQAAFGDSLRNAYVPQPHPRNSALSLYPSLPYPFTQNHAHNPGSGLNPRNDMFGLSPWPNRQLHDVLDRTSMFDYASKVDAEGNPLPERLANYLQHAYHDPQVTEKELEDLLNNIRPDMDIPRDNWDGTPAGLKDKLYRHQELALTWMKKMEQGTNKGGILADDMGLGKTISTLALMLARPPAHGLPKTTLIVAPVALVRQWQEEIVRKTKLSHRLSVFIYHNKKTTVDELLRYDVVLTTYGTVAQEHGRYEKFCLENKGRSVDMNDRATASKFPLLHPNKAKFYRVVLDEAQCIKNRKTKTAMACNYLQATHRWCLTGTPMMNSIQELFSLVQFLGIKPHCVWEKFRHDFGGLFGGRRCEPKHNAMNRFRALLKAIMLRRKKDSKLDGKPILNLPRKTESIVHAKLSPDERGYYKQLEEKSQVQFSKYLREGTVGKNYSNILVLLLRMRQACCHPHLNVDVDDAATTSNDAIRDEVKNLEQRVVERIKAIEAFECPICFDAVQSPSFFIPCGHDSCRDCLARLLDNAAVTNLQDGDESDRVKCPQCRTAFDPKKCFSLETFRSVHMPKTVVKKSDSDGEESGEDDDDDDEDDDDDDDDDATRESGDDVDKNGNLRDFVVPDDDFSDDDAETKKLAATAKARRKARKGKRKQVEVKPTALRSLRQEALKNREAYKRFMRYLRKTWLPSAKVTECMELLKKIQEKGEKVIIFSQWTLLLDLLQVAMRREGFSNPERYDGSMSGDQRADAARSFTTDSRVRVMLVSLRAGNAGLNLTAASSVIIMDPFWNPYIEMQAIDRAHRIGQQREVSVYRILSEDTVEDRIIELQMRKKEMVEAALDETESMKIGRLNVNELRFLFNTRD
ncbi:hypothetical protein CP533_3518 [Ophiocordyceps camponoti-saundersi (nom. inval.)]|nr:hypothetical protein CP533_3518 [Ophiocordyceps camponoti-saundersi (nom. inval.)]